MASPLSSRKVIVTIAAMACSVGLLLGALLIDRSALVANKELFAIALFGIFGVGGYQIQQQAKIDSNGDPHA